MVLFDVAGMVAIVLYRCIRLGKCGWGTVGLEVVKALGYVSVGVLKCLYGKVVSSDI